jgi:serine/threonine protein kinase
VPGVPPDLVNHPRYLILEYLGSGGMGTVFKARHLLMDRLVALKVINPAVIDRPVMVERFQREVKAAARLRHPNIVAAYDADQAGATHFLVMELVEGVDLDRVLQERGPLPIAKACDYARQAALGLQHAWECGMIHRDIKPHNLMLTPQGQVKILDFGLARFVSSGISAAEESTASAPLPGAGAAVPEQAGGAPDSQGPPLIKGTSYSYTGAGTADYIAPEETVDTRRADIRADIYSLGCTLYRFLAGRVPFPDGNLTDKLKSHLERQPVPLPTLRPEVPRRLVQFVERMMAKDPAQRFQTPAEVVQALAPFAGPSHRSILIVDDDQTTRAVLTLALEREGCSVSQASNGQEALDRLRAAPRPNLILLDLMMPVMDGWQFLSQVKADPALASIPIFVLSAVDHAHTRAAALGAVDYLVKPFDPREVAEKVRDLTGEG